MVGDFDRSDFHEVPPFRWPEGALRQSAAFSQREKVAAKQPDEGMKRFEVVLNTSTS
jgi:hypothetical protein